MSRDEGDEQSSVITLNDGCRSDRIRQNPTLFKSGHPMNAVTIPISDVAPAGEPEPRLELHASDEGLLQRRVEAMALADERMVSCKDTHPFAQAAHDAFYDHCPLTIGPD